MYAAGLALAKGEGGGEGREGGRERCGGNGERREREGGGERCGVMGRGGRGKEVRKEVG